MKSILAVLFFGTVASGLFWWEVRSGTKLPSWAFVIAAIPMVLVRFFNSRSSDGSETERGFALVFLFLSSIGLMVLGAMGSAMRGTWGEILSPALPVGAVGLGVTFIAAWFHFRE